MFIVNSSISTVLTIVPFREVKHPQCLSDHDILGAYLLFYNLGTTLRKEIWTNPPVSCCLCEKQSGNEVP